MLTVTMIVLHDQKNGEEKVGIDHVGLGDAVEGPRYDENAAAGAAAGGSVKKNGCQNQPDPAVVDGQIAVNIVEGEGVDLPEFVPFHGDFLQILPQKTGAPMLQGVGGQIDAARQGGICRLRQSIPGIKAVPENEGRYRHHRNAVFCREAQKRPQPPQQQQHHQYKSGSQRGPGTRKQTEKGADAE